MVTQEEQEKIEKRERRKKREALREKMRAELWDQFREMNPRESSEGEPAYRVRRFQWVEARLKEHTNAQMSHDGAVKGGKTTAAKESARPRVTQRGSLGEHSDGSRRSRQNS